MVLRTSRWSRCCFQCFPKRRRLVVDSSRIDTLFPLFQTPATDYLLFDFARGANEVDGLRAAALKASPPGNPAFSLVHRGQGSANGLTELHLVIALSDSSYLYSFAGIIDTFAPLHRTTHDLPNS